MRRLRPVADGLKKLQAQHRQASDKRYSTQGGKRECARYRRGRYENGFSRFSFAEKLCRLSSRSIAACEVIQLNIT